MLTQTSVPQKSLLQVTSSAVNKIHALLIEEDNFNLKLRVYIEGGGCSGFQYGFTFDETVDPDDIVVTQNLSVDEEQEDETDQGQGTNQVQLLIDPMSFQYLVGAQIDYKDDLDGARFIIRNPNANTTCGCGSSFSV